MNHDKIMLFHTTLRNIGLFISISFASLTYASNKANEPYAFYLLMNSILFTFISLLLSIQLIEVASDPVFTDETIMNKLPYLLVALDIVLLVIGLNKLRLRLSKI